MLSRVSYLIPIFFFPFLLIFINLHWCNISILDKYIKFLSFLSVYLLQKKLLRKKISFNNLFDCFCVCLWLQYLSDVLFITCKIGNLYNPVNSLCFHKEETYIFSMSLYHCRSLMNFYVILCPCMLSKKIESFWLLLLWCDSSQIFFYFICVL